MCHLLNEGRRFPQGPPISSASKIDRHDMTLDVERGVKPQSICQYPIPRQSGIDLNDPVQATLTEDWGIFSQLVLDSFGAKV